MMKRRKGDLLLRPFNFAYRDVIVKFDPHDLDVVVDINLNIYVDGELVTLNREESMRFLREYFVYLDQP